MQRLLVLAPIMALLLVMAWTASQGIPDSISSYHGGQYRDVFVAGLVGTAIALVGYWGVTPVEDFTLNLAGFYAIVVALVPNDIADQISREATMLGHGQANPRDVVRVILGCLLVTTATFVFIDYRRGGWSAGLMMLADSRLRNLTLASLGVLIAYSVWLVVNVANPTTMFEAVHRPAATLLFVQLGIAPAAQGWQWMPQPHEPSRAYRYLYRAVAIAMIVAVVAIPLLLGQWRQLPQAVLVLEVVEVVLFAVFWVGELTRFWRVAGSRPGSPG